MSAAKKKKRSSSGVAWTVVAIIAVIAVGATVGLFVLGKGGKPASTPTPTPSATASQSASPTPTVPPTDGPDQIRSQIVSIVASGDATQLVGYMADPVKYVRFGSDAPTATYKPAQLGNQLTTDLADQSWEPADNTLIAQWQDSAWAKYFPAGAQVMYSDQDHFLSVILDANNKISMVVYGTAASLS